MVIMFGRLKINFADFSIRLFFCGAGITGDPSISTRLRRRLHRHQSHYLR